MHQPFSASFDSLAVIIVTGFPDAEMWLPFESWRRKSVIRVFSSMGVAWYSVFR